MVATIGAVCLGPAASASAFEFAACDTQKDQKLDTTAAEPCRLALDASHTPSGQAPGEDAVQVVYHSPDDGAVAIDHGGKDGWTFVDGAPGDTIELGSSICQRIQNETADNAEVEAYDQAGNRYVSFEAEGYDANIAGSDFLSDHAWADDTFTSGIYTMEARPVDGGQYTGDDYADKAPRLDYRVNFTDTGTYYLWVRAEAEDGSSDSVHMGLDGQTVTTGERLDFGSYDNLEWSSQRMNDQRAKIEITSAGVHTINLWMREDGIEVDKIVMHDASWYSPSEDGPDVSSRGSFAPAPGSGVAADAGPDEVYVQSQAADPVVIDARNFQSQQMAADGHYWKEVARPGSCTGTSMAARPDSGVRHNSDYVAKSPRLDYQIDFADSGNYFVFLRGRGGDDSDSAHIGVDGVGQIERLSDFRDSSLGYSDRNGTMDGELTEIYIDSPGVHAINVWMREDGFVFDRMIIKQDSSTPVGCTDPATRRRKVGGQITTQVACYCPKIEGDACRPPDGSSCQYGSWTCDRTTWEDVCQPAAVCKPGCAAPTSHQLSFDNPRVQAVVDKSGSMGTWDKVDDDRWVRRWSAAEDAFTQLAAATDQIDLGVHFWSKNIKKAISAWPGTTASAVANAFDFEPSGGTRFDQATKSLEAETKLQDSSRTNVGVFVTDGKPDQVFTALDSIRDLCALRDRADADGGPITTYSIGFGKSLGDADGLINSTLAAAGGTGQCCIGADCNPDDSAQRADICDMVDYELEPITRNGQTKARREHIIDQFEALLDDHDRDDEWRNILEDLPENHKIEVAYDALVVFDLQDTPRGQALAEKLSKTVGYYVRQHYTDSDLAAEDIDRWWYLKNTGDHQATIGHQLTCTGAILADDGGSLKTELLGITSGLDCTFPLTLPDNLENAPDAYDATSAKLLFADASESSFAIPHVDRACGGSVGDACVVPDGSGGQTTNLDKQIAGLGISGDYSEEGWFFPTQGRTTLQLTDGVCELLRQRKAQKVVTQVCGCSKVGQACDVSCDSDEPFCGPDGELTGRCGAGEYICVGGQDTCVQVRNPMPEVCNGIDDDCDGAVDNLSASWKQPKFSGFQLDDDHQAIACYQRNVCQCPSGPSDVYAGTSDGDEFADYQDGWQADCVCGSSLQAQPSESSSAGGYSAAPSTAPPSPTGSAAGDVAPAACSVRTADSPARAPGAALAAVLGALLGAAWWRRSRGSR